MQRVQLVGLDFGTTTSSAIVATARLRHHAVQGRVELSDFQEQFRSELTFTPIHAGQLDLARTEQILDGWLRAGGVDPGSLFGGGALLTGLTAQAANAAGLIGLIRQRLGDTLIARADDPHLESWLAFMGSCAGVSRAHPEQTFLNLDIGGGTTNLALGRAGEVLWTDCLFIGARHFQVVLGSYRLTEISRYGREVLDAIGLRKRVGDDLSEADVDRILDHYVKALAERISKGAAPTLSGGVGELVYRRVRGEPWPSTTAFGDLGIDLARRLFDMAPWREHWQRFQPAAGGRATVLGLLRHNTHVSGSTIFLPFPGDLPIGDLPILGTLCDRSDFTELIRLAAHCPRGAGLRLILEDASAQGIRAFAERMAGTLRDCDYPPARPLVIFTSGNIGKVLGQYITEWGAAPRHLTVIDEIAAMNAQYAHVGVPRDQVIPVSFFGLNAPNGR